MKMIKVWKKNAHWSPFPPSQKKGPCGRTKCAPLIQLVYVEYCGVWIHTY